jgi:hypothetical protein
MKSLRYLALLTAAIGLFFATSTKSQAQISINIGPEPVCPYGYYDYAPYACAPYGYYGPEWFVGGVFVGAGPWFHGPADFHGNVNNRFDPHHGYKGPAPKRGEQRPAARSAAPTPKNFKGNESRDGRGHVAAKK